MMSKKKSDGKHLLSQAQLKNAFVTGSAFNIELHSRKPSVPEHLSFSRK